MNNIVILGRLTADPDVRATQTGKTCTNFTVAVDRKYKQEGQPDADFIRCVAWGKQAEVIGKWFNKGTRIALNGRLQTRSYDKDGQRQYTTEIIVEEFDFCNSKTDTNDCTNVYTQDDTDVPF